MPTKVKAYILPSEMPMSCPVTHITAKNWIKTDKVSGVLVGGRYRMNPGEAEKTKQIVNHGRVTCLRLRSRVIWSESLL